ncbi:IAA acetyltransferase/MarR transcriptional regulatory protein [Legionella moravica]|uniref:IAA acetyltransferase/MarR transcriptional regulatory protein n=1 Tax=Legionella moravica TaxID=39962 RepID=A0A378JWV0_9GAMM|nr:bifunctional helix-turn-helix transcriptional regulator/GNAT family N-acetyltransferase [Legionella moravica]KTD32094.1 IAA acetyltransferase/MarR transcriptional regulatory protein [Legionella moravica]STX63044.1 IAA acetyltransferase/MarR transcriptional regulatory protein [Legionella moravica]
MMNDSIDTLRHHSRKLIRELGMLQLNKIDAKEQPSYWHALIEINKEPNVTSAKLSQLLLISMPTLSRIVTSLIKEGLVSATEGIDKRERFLRITDKGKEKIHYIDEYSNSKIKRAFHFLTQEDKEQVISAIGKYALALEQSRIARDQVKLLRLSTSRTLRKQIMTMIERIQVEEFNIPVTADINISILKAEDNYYFNNSCNFWYAVDAQGTIIGSIGLKKINNEQGELKKFFLTPEYRGLGIASLLLRTLIKNSLKHGFKELFLGTVEQLQAAQKFYERHGFQAIKKESLPGQFVVCPVDTLFYRGETKKIEQLLDELV